MKRRTFIETGILGSIVAGGKLLSGCDRPLMRPRTGEIVEEARNIPVAGKYDVVVCGAGPAGVCAAIAAGRNGAKTLLIETLGCLGGVWTAGLVAWILDHSNKTGMMREIEDRLRKMEALSPVDISKRNIAFDVEKMKLLLEIMCIEAGVDILLHSRVVSVKKNERNRLSHVITESRSFREAWEGKVFIDTTGNGDLATLSGCNFDFGNEADGSFQPMSLLMLVTGIKFNEIKSFVRWAGDTASESKKRLLQEMSKANIKPSYEYPSIFPIDTDLFMIMTNHEYGLSGLDSRETTRATLHARQELYNIVEGLRSLGSPWANLRIVATSEQIGIREGRRIHGLYTVTRDDLIKGIKHPDSVCTVNFGVDVHSVTKDNESQNVRYSQGIKSKPYDIPLRALIAKDVSGLMMAGRCISGDFIAHSSYRVTGNAVAMGEAAGKTAALSAQTNRLPQEVNWKEIASETL